MPTLEAKKFLTIEEYEKWFEENYGRFLKSLPDKDKTHQQQQDTFAPVAQLDSANVS